MLAYRMNLSSKKVISFEDFYAKFYKSDPRSKNALYPPQRAIVTVAKKAETQEKYAVTWAHARSFAIMMVLNLADTRLCRD